MSVGGDEIHLRSAHAHFNIVLASTIRNQLAPADVVNNRGTVLSDAKKLFENSDSDYQSDPAGDKQGSERDARDEMLTWEPETEVFKDNT